MIGYVVLGGIVVAAGLAYIMVVLLDRRDKKKSQLYDLRCERCGGQLDWREAGRDTAGCLQIQVAPCPRCCPLKTLEHGFNLGGEPAQREDLHNREDMD